MNFKNITNEILSTGLTQAELAEKAQCSQGLISAYSRGVKGKSPSYELGTRLIAIHKQLAIKVRRSGGDHV